MRREIATNVSVTNGMGTVLGIKNWSFAVSQDLSAGTHTISVAAALAPGGGTAYSSVTATIGGDSNSVLQPQLTVIIIKK